MMRIGGKMGMGGQKVDAIDFLTAKIKKIEGRIDEVREGMSNRKVGASVMSEAEGVLMSVVRPKTMDSLHSPKFPTLTSWPRL
jgi:hypothetical protein